ncbi:type II secretion system F family protein [Candidatus Woesearchaeota archaeon]|nr:type II secretion system F family protein [Candidatus Woesearchaeota archaeon]
MSGEIANSAKNILSYIENLNTIINQINLISGIKSLTADQKKQINDLKAKKVEILSKIDSENAKIYKIINPPQNIEPPKPTIKNPQVLPRPQLTAQKEAPAPMLQKIVESPSFTSEKFKNLSKEEKKKFIKEANINVLELKKFIKLQKEKGRVKVTFVKENYSIYKPSRVGEITNKYMKKYADALVKKYPKLFDPMFSHFKMVEMEILSRTYISMTLFFTILSLPAIFLFFLALNFAFNLSIVKILLISFAGMILTFFGFYFYPASLIGGKNTKIKLELPFALVHMSAVAGSGANPISVFELIAESDEYLELRKEIKKILNYVNLFGYNLTNALKNVAATTPNPELKELLNGMISTIETGGDLKGYLKEKADDALNTYRLDRKKQVEALSTYSEIYTAILIASPLLLLVTLAIINSIGGNIAGLSVATIAWISIIGALPLLNIGFMFFISISQKGL